MSERPEPRVLDVCEDLHMLANGGVEMSDEDALRLEKWLSNKLDRWHDGHHISNRAIYDHAVKLLAIAALTEWRLSSFHPHWAKHAIAVTP